MLAPIERLHRKLEVVSRRHRDDDGIDRRIAQRLVVASVAPHPTVAPLTLGRARRIAAGIAADHVLPHLLQVATVHPGDEPAPEEREVNRLQSWPPPKKIGIET
jgi:hypothetical protein